MEVDGEHDFNAKVKKATKRARCDDWATQFPEGLEVSDKLKKEAAIEAYHVKLENNEHDEYIGADYTCIMWEGELYTTDSQGFFIHENKLMRCVINEDRVCEFIQVAVLTQEEADAVDSLGSLNCIKNTVSDGKGFYY